MSEIGRSMDLRMKIYRFPQALSIKRPFPYRLTLPTATLLLLTATLLGMLSGAAHAVPWPSVVLAGNHPVRMASLRPAAHADPAAHLNLQITLAVRNRDQLDQLLLDQQNPASPRYHHWLTPAQFAARFGRSPQDLDALVQWLTAQAFTVNAASLTQRSVRFTGAVADAERAFGTNIMVFGDGRSYSNITDPAIPARFGGMISAIGGLDNFLHSVAVSQHYANNPEPVTSEIAGRLALLDSVAPIPGSRIGSNPGVTVGGTTAFGPADFHTFYDENPLLAGGVNGAGGDCIAIVGDSDYTSGAVSLFNSEFGLPASSITTVLVNGSNPGINGDELESLLDLEWSHAAAPGAPTRFYLGNPNSSSANGPIVDAIQSAVNQNVCGTISVSFGLCGGSASFFTGTLSGIYAQAAAQGQSVIISAGDWGAAGLAFDPSSNSCVTATSRNVNEMASDPNVTQIGGTKFDPTYDASGNDVGSVAEAAWDDEFTDPGGGATGGGVSAFYTKPAYQKGAGVPADGMRDVPDVALIASDFHPGVFVGMDNGGSPAIGCCIGGTSLSAPAWAGFTKLIAQLQGSRPGPLNPRIYALANAGLAGSGFRDVLSGNNDFNGVTGFTAGPGFDLTSGWGTVDVGTFATVFAAPSSPPVISSIPSPILVGSNFTINGSSFSPKAEVNFFVATANGPVNAGPLVPSSNSGTQIVVPVPVTVPLGEGFVSVQVVNVDRGFVASNVKSALLQGSAAAGIPTILRVNGVTLAPTSSDPAYATNNVQTVILQGKTVTLGGTGFDAANGVAVNVFCSCTGGRIPPIFLSPGASLTSTSLSFTLPLSACTGPSSLVVINRGADGSYSKASNAVSVPLGAAISVTSVTQSGSTIAVNGSGFSTLTVINLFNTQSGGIVNLGGLGAGGVAKIPLTVIATTHFTFTKPAGAAASASYVQALNPPFVPFSSSGTSPGGAFTMH
jgi:hypothetical protein